MLQRFWDCSRLESKGVTAYAAKSAKMPSVLHASMHPEGLFDFVTMRRHSPRAFANPSQKSHSGFAHVGSDGLRR